MTVNDLENNLSHARAAYIHAIRALPSESSLRNGPLVQHGLKFSSLSQIHAQQVELGWAFYCRYEACLEKWLKDQGVKLSKSLSLEGWLENKGVIVSEERASGLQIYRTIRNALHHDDGATFDGGEEPEFHLMPEHMERFFQLFVWASKEIEIVIHKE